jgi:hypothetical protein
MSISSLGQKLLICTEFQIEQLAAACMTWDLAESGKHFITTIINGSDLVPTFSASSVDDLRSEVYDLLCLYVKLHSQDLSLPPLGEIFLIL